MSSVCSYVWLVTSGIGAVACFSGAVTFGIFGNSPAAIWCVIACVLAIANTYVRGVEVFGRLERWYSLKAVADIRDLGMCLCIIFLGYFGYTLFEVIKYHEHIYDISKSKVIVAVWCFVSAKYSFSLFLAGRRLVHLLSETRTLLLDE